MSSAEHERLLRRARAQDAALFRYRLIVLAMAAALKRENMERTAAQVRRIMVASSGDAPSERTLQRHFAREDLTTSRGTTVFGRLEAEAPNVLWTGDVLHGPLIGGKKTYLV